jgi:hypothetical protein
MMLMISRLICPVVMAVRCSHIASKYRPETSGVVGSSSCHAARA